MDLDVVGAGVVEQELVELLAVYLPGLGTFVWVVIEEIERLGQLAVVVDELHAVFLDKSAPFHPGKQVEPLQDPVGLRDQRLADVEAREALALEEEDAVTVLGDQRGHSRTGGPAADDYHIGRPRLQERRHQRTPSAEWGVAAFYLFEQHLSKQFF